MAEGTLGVGTLEEGMAAMAEVGVGVMGEGEEAGGVE